MYNGQYNGQYTINVQWTVQLMYNGHYNGEYTINVQWTVYNGCTIQWTTDGQ